MKREHDVDLVLNGWVLRHPVSGVSVYVRLLTEALAKAGARLSWRLAIPRPHADLAVFVPPERLILVDGLANVSGYLSSEFYWNQKIASHVRRHHPDAIFHSAFHFWAALQPRRLLCTAHDCIEQRVGRDNRMRRLYRQLCWRAVRKASRVIAVSEWTRNDLIEIERVRAEKIVTLHNWVRPDFQRAGPHEIAVMRARYKLPERYIAYVGGYRSYKNVGMLVHAWNRARSQLHIPALVLAGHVPQKENDECGIHDALAAAGAAAVQVLTPGLIRDEDLAAFYSGAALFVSPSRYEGFGYPAVEAMACDTPILVADASAFREVVPAAHQRFSPDNSEALAAMILEAIANPGRFRCPLPEMFTEKHGGERYLALIESMLADRRKSV